MNFKNPLQPVLVRGTRHLGATLKRLCAVTLGGLVFLAASCGGSSGQDSAWVGTWSTSPTGPEDRVASAAFLPSITQDNVTLRMIVRSSVAGGKVRVRFSNEIGDAPAPVLIGSAHVALRAQGSTIVTGTDRALTFGGKSSVTIPAKGQVMSDPIDLAVPALADLAVSVYLPQRTIVQSIHFVSRQASYVVAGSDATGLNSLPATAAVTTTWFMLTGIDVVPSKANVAAMVTLGDSITDGFGQSTTRVDAPTPWPAWPSRLAERLQGDATLSRLAVLNEGIAGNRILNDASQTVPASVGGLTQLSIYGPRATARFGRDVAGQTGVSCVLVFEGINDIGQGASRGQVVTADQIIAGQRQLIAQARAAGLRVMGATLTPFNGYSGALYYSPENEAKRQAVNTWIRSAPGEFDGIVDFDALLRDPTDQTRLLSQYDSGDHLHPSDIGYVAMANGVNLDMLARLCFR